MKAIAGSKVVVLGGTAGVGLEIACQFAEQGAKVVVLGRNEQRGDTACETVRKRIGGAEIDFIKVDAMKADDVVRAEARARDLMGGLDTLICSTGPSQPPRLLKNISIGSLHDRINEIIMPPMLMVHAALPAMRAQNHGVIINVASDAAKVATPGETLVGAAMAAIVMFSRTVALEEKRHRIRVNLLTPSLVANTPGAQLIFAEEFSAKLFEKASKLAHLGIVEPEDLAAAALFLASPAARKMTGQSLSINGGISVG
ncbi:MAG: SDR family NAD(P)-dependent oxidoreductase [Porticoccaceae bacterium]